MVEYICLIEKQRFRLYKNILGVPNVKVFDYKKFGNNAFFLSAGFSNVR